MGSGETCCAYAWERGLWVGEGVELWHRAGVCRGHAAALPAAVRTPLRPRWGRVLK